MRVIKSLVFAACLAPLLRIVWRVFAGLEVNPVEALLHSSGLWALIFLLVSLAISPLRALPGLGKLILLRRMLGLYAFFYAAAHVGLYVALDQGLVWAAIWRDFWRRPFITVGLAAFVLLIPLAITSSDGWMRRLKRNWQRLHWLVYPAAVLAVLHFWWLVKRDIREPAAYALALAVLLIWRVWRVWRSRRRGG